MVNTTAFTERLEKILDHYELNATAFAEEIGVQRSSISHLLSGRNKPSLDFVMKVINRFPEVNLYWLLNGKGSFPRAEAPAPPLQTSDMKNVNTVGPEASGGAIEKIVVFYSNGRFREYIPG